MEFAGWGKPMEQPVVARWKQGKSHRLRGRQKRKKKHGDNQ
jgi:hypothetical protein